MRHLYLICTWSACSSWTAWNQNKWLSLLKHWPSKLPEPLVEAQFPAKSARVSGSGWKRAWNGLIQSIWCFLCCQCNASETFCQNCQFLVLTEDPLSKGASYWTMRQWPDDMAGIPSNLRHDRWAFSFLLVGPDSYYTLLRKYSWINLFPCSSDSPVSILPNYFLWRSCFLAGRSCLEARLLTPVAPNARMMSGFSCKAFVGDWIPHFANIICESSW